jgi:hypothetical protein
MNPIVEIITAIVRPAITVMFGAAIVQLVTQGVTPPAWFLGVAIPTITWWFIDRSVKHIKERNNELWRN